MASLLTAADKADIEAVFTDLHDTFKRAITVYTKKETTVSSNPSEYNHIYNRTNNVNKGTPTLQPSTIYARIKHYNPSDTLIDDKGQLSLLSKDTRVRIKVAAADNETIKNAVKIEIDGILFSDISSDGIIGPFQAQFYSYILTRE